MSLRGYQVRAIEQLRAQRASGSRSILLALPTGSGKSVVMAEIIRSAVSHGRRVLVVVHLRELIDQMWRHLSNAGVDFVGVIRGDDDRVAPLAPVQLASIQTLARRTAPQADIVLLDEAHRSIAQTYERNVWDTYPEATIIGVTATPCRGDGRGLGKRFNGLVVGAAYSELIAAGHIAEPIVYAPEVAPDLEGVRRVGGDWAEGELEQRMTALVGNLHQEWAEKARGRSTIVFATSIAHSKDIVERFCTAGVAAEHLDGTTPASDRAACLERLRSGETTVVSNVGVLTEGFDAPGVRCVVMARPTLSLVLHMQTAGRALRPGDVQPIILDHAGNCQRHGLPHMDREWTLEEGGKPVIKNPYKTCTACFVYVPARATACPYCGFEFPKAEPKPLPQETGGRLAEYKPTEADLERDFFSRELERARTRGFKPGFAGAKFKEKFGRWPPWSWSQDAKAMFASDDTWQERNANRERERAFWAEHDKRNRTEEQ